MAPFSAELHDGYVVDGWLTLHTLAATPLILLDHLWVPFSSFAKFTSD